MQAFFNKPHNQANLLASKDLQVHRHLFNKTTSHLKKITVKQSHMIQWRKCSSLFIITAQLFATLITRCAKDIDLLIDSLPNDDSSPELQVQSLQTLENENRKESEGLEEVVKKGEDLLEKIQAALSEIAKHMIDTRLNE